MRGTAGSLTIDLDAIAANWRLLAARAAPARCAAVVKADGYGLGAAEVSRRLRAEGCQWFFAAHLEEAAALTPLLPDATVVALNGLLPGNEADTIAHQVVPTLNDLGQIALWQAEARRRNRSLPAIIHLDTGMNRLGLHADAIDRLAAEPALLDGIDVVLWLSHFACADLKDHPLNAAQQVRFAQALQRLPRAQGVSLANSSGIFLGPAAHYDVVRPGAALYGINPTPWTPNPMRAVARVTGKIVQIHSVDTGGTVGYGAEWRAGRQSRIATVAVGYADGYLRSGKNRAHVAFEGTRLPVIGRISMDLITIDATDLRAAIVPGSEVELLGHTISADELGESAGTIGYEILTQLGKRYHRSYQGAVA